MGTRVGEGRRMAWDVAVVWLLLAVFCVGFWVGVGFAVAAVTG